MNEFSHKKLKESGITHFNVIEEEMHIHWCSFTCLRALSKFYCGRADKILKEDKIAEVKKQEQMAEKEKIKKMNMTKTALAVNETRVTGRRIIDVSSGKKRIVSNELPQNPKEMETIKIRNKSDASSSEESDEKKEVPV